MNTSSILMGSTADNSLIRHWNRVAELARDRQQDEIGSPRIGAIESVIDAALPDALRRFQQQKPRMACQIVSGNTDSLSQAISQDELDFAVCGEPSDPSAFYFEPLHEERVILVADRHHPLNGRSSIPFEDVLRYPVIAGGRTCLYYMLFAKHLSRYEEAPPRCIQ